MKKEKENASKKKVVFSETIDSRIDGLSIGVAFIFIGLFLLYRPNYFNNEMVNTCIRWIFIVLGILFIWNEFYKVSDVPTIKGIDDFWVGAVLIAVWIILMHLAKNVIGNIIGFVCLVLGAYGLFRGIIKIGYSIYLNQREVKGKQPFPITEIVLFLTKIVSFALVVVQIIKALQK